MLKRDYFLWAINRNLAMRRSWLVEVFCIKKEYPAVQDATYEGQLVRGPNPDLYYFKGKGQDGKYAPILIEDAKVGSAIFSPKEPVMLKAGEIPILDHDIATTYGRVVGNAVILMYPFGTKFKYSQIPFGGWFEKILEQRVEDNLTVDVRVNNVLIKQMTKVGEDPSKIYVHEFLTYGEACGYLASLAPMFASSGSVKAMTVDKSVLAYRDKLLKEYAHDLDNRATQVMIEQKLVAADKASFKGDPAEDFHISEKSYNPTRKKALILIGGEDGFGDDGDRTFIGKSLRDKWDVKDIPAHANSARAGSYFRGKETQFGGADVKMAYRMSFSLRVAKEDFCGTTRGVANIIDEANKKYFMGLYIVGKKGPILITEENVTNYYGRPVMVHSPEYCKSGGTTLCKVCLGKTYGKLGNGLPAMIANIGDVFMYDKMKRMHGKAGKTTYLNVKAICY